MLLAVKDTVDMLDIDILSDPNPSSDLIYHYTSRQTAIEHILSERKLKFNSLCNTNDPLEFLDLHHVAVGDASAYDKSGLFDLAVQGNRVGQLARKVCKIACFSADSEPFNVQSNPGGLFTKGSTRARMWSQYADGHRGVCLVFSRQKLYDTLLGDTHSIIVPQGSNVSIFNDYLTYDNALHDLHKALTMEFNEAQKNKSDFDRLAENARAYLFSKLEDYREEQEYRFALYSSKGFETGGHILVDYADSLEAVILGCKFPNSYFINMNHLSSSRNFLLSQIYWYNGRPEIELVDNRT